MTSAIFGFAAATISTLLLWAQQRFVFKLRRARVRSQRAIRSRNR